MVAAMTQAVLSTGRSVLRSVMDREPRATATIPDWTSSLMPNGSRTRISASSLSDVDDLRAEQLHGLEDVRSGREVGLHLHEQQLPLHRRVRVELDDLDDVDELVQLLGHLLERQLLDVDDDRHPRHLGLLGRTDRERIDVEAATREQTGNPRQHARLVLDENGQGMAAHSDTTSPIS
jgi:hypothetical protein